MCIFKHLHLSADFSSKSSKELTMNKNKDKCRTCLKPSSKMLLLNSVPTKTFNGNKTYLNLLEDLTQIKFDTSKAVEMPQGVCFICRRKIHESYSFIRQVHKCNEILMTVSKISDDKCSQAAEDISTQESCEMDFVKNETSDGYSYLESYPEAMGNHQEINENHFQPCNSYSYTVVKLESEQHDGFSQGHINEHSQFENNETLVIENNRYDPLKEEIPNYDFEENSNPVLCEDSNTHSLKGKRRRLQNDTFAKHKINENDITSDEDKSINTDEDTYDPLNELSNVSLGNRMKQISCEECNRVFTKLVLLNRHRKACHPSSRIKLQCTHCPSQFNKRHKMDAHIKKFHETTASELKSQEEPIKQKETYACDYCEKSYQNKYNLIAHVKSKHVPDGIDKQAEKRFLCTLCGIAFNSESNLDIHYRRHNGERPFKCELCERAYATLYEVQIHRRSHTGEKPFRCSVCEKRFITNQKLKRHMRTHSNERPYKCTQCEKAFKQSKDLNIHKRIHTGEKPYKCGVCNSTFTQSNSLKIHQKNAKHTEVV